MRKIMKYKSMYCDECVSGSKQEVEKRNVKWITTSDYRKKTPYDQIVDEVINTYKFKNGDSITVVPKVRMPSIKDVIFNPPATIVIWDDGVKTVVKAHNEQFDPEKGLAMAITKRALGNKGSYNNVINKHVNAYYERVQEEIDVAKQLVEGLAEGMTKVGESARDAATALANAAATAIDNLTPYRIWYRVYKDGKLVESGMSLKAYKREGNAKAAAKKLYKDRPDVTWVVSKTNPWPEEKTDSE